MTSLPPLFKRIKRHIIGRDHKFFAATPPGFETICLQELLKLKPVAGKARATAGGVEFEGRLEVGYHANLNLRSANRILMRVGTFKATHFRQLEKSLRGIPWELYLPRDSLLKVNATTKHCRLHHSGAIAERFQKAIVMRLSSFEAEEAEQKSHVAPSVVQTIYVRGLEDRFMVSLDSSGDILYKRGLKRHTGSAPLRETLAAAALLLAGYDGRVPLIDPMCGTGTFSLEAALMAKHIPAGWFRNFAFTRWPSFLTKRWNYIRRKSESGFMRLEQPLIFASDKDGGACRKLESCAQMHDLTDAVRVHQKDFFDLDPGGLTDQSGVVCLNPPYGLRLGGRQESEKLFAAICDKLKQAYNGWKLVLFTPGRKLASTVPVQAKPFPVVHGGLKLVLMIGKIE
jgi:putative N6-adenine-specific DNA methylase